MPSAPPMRVLRQGDPGARARSRADRRVLLGRVPYRRRSPADKGHMTSPRSCPEHPMSPAQVRRLFGAFVAGLHATGTPLASIREGISSWVDSDLNWALLALAAESVEAAKEQP